MEGDNRTPIIIDVQVNNEKVAEKLAEATNALAEQRTRLAELRKETEGFTKVSAEQAKEIAAVKSNIEQQNRAVKSNTALLQAATIQNIDTRKSLDEQRQAVNTLQKAYANMDATTEEGADAREKLATQIKAATDALKEQEHAIGDDRRNVGNYTESIEKASGAFSLLKESSEAAGVAGSVVGGVIDKTDKAMRVMTKNPLMGMISLLLPLVIKLGQAIMGNEQAMEAVNKIMAQMRNYMKAFEPLINRLANLVTKVLGKALEWLTKALQGILKGVDKVMGWFGKETNLAASFESLSEAEEHVAESTDKITESVRELKNELADLAEAEQLAEELLAGLNAQADKLIEERRKRRQQLAADAAAEQEQLQAEEDAWAEEDVKRAKDLLTARQEAAEQERAEVAASIEMYKQKASAMSSSFKAMSDVLAQYGEQNEEAAKAAKAFGIMSIITDEAITIADTATAITTAVAGATEAAAATGPAAPFTLAAYIAEMVGLVIGAVASVASSIMSAKSIINGADQFATGGIVPGTSYYGDNVPVRVNSGEMILNQQQQARLFDIANGRGGIVDYDALGATMAAAVSAQPAPIMDYSEFVRFQRKVAMYDQIARI